MNQKLDELDRLLDEAKKYAKYIRTDFLTGNTEHLHEDRMKLQEIVDQIGHLSEEITDEWSQ
jgi:hypothetical protein